MKKHRRLQDVYQFPGYRPKAAIQGIFGDPHSIVIKMVRLQKKQNAAVVARYTESSMTEKYEEYEICRAETNVYIWKLRLDVFFARSASW